MGHDGKAPGAQDRGKMKGWIPGSLVLIAVAIGIAMAMMNSGGQDGPSAARIEAEKAAAAERCRQDIQCIGEKLGADASIHCTPPIEKKVGQPVEWTNAAKKAAFDRIRWKEPGQVLTLVGDQLRLQNRFGAWENLIYECDLDVRTSEPVAVRTRVGKF